jgi:hypothetical protein
VRQPSFTQWLGDPNAEPVRLSFTGELLNWAAQGLGGDQIEALLHAVQSKFEEANRTSELHNSAFKCIHGTTYPWRIEEVIPVLSLSNAYFTISFAPAKKRYR